VAESVLVIEISLARFGLFHTLAGDDAVAFVAEPGKRAGVSPVSAAVGDCDAMDR
jgi:hypothetical protein